MPEVLRRVPATRLLVIGDGSQRSTLARRARELGIDARLTWTGSLSREDTLLHLAAADLAVVPSQFEGFGLAAVEAMACRKAVVASCVDGLREVIRDQQTGRLVPYGNTPELVEALVGLLLDEEKRRTLGAGGRERVEKLFSKQVFTQRYLALYQALSPRQKKRAG
jgi:glycosyltransferase involved in cell wall biosynthesis